MMLKTYIVVSPMGEREWQAEDEDHAREQHVDAFGNDPDETILSVRPKDVAMTSEEYRDVREAFMLAMMAEGIDTPTIESVCATVDDAVVNNMGED